MYICVFIFISFGQLLNTLLLYTIAICHHKSGNYQLILIFSMIIIENTDSKYPLLIKASDNQRAESDICLYLQAQMITVLQDGLGTYTFKLKR